jgi:ABC-type bacteriocin/lantibiotic exporter with double-glycine peptidase domain
VAPLFLAALFVNIQRMFKTKAESQVIVEETMQGISVVKAFANEWYEIARYNGKIKEVVKIAIKGGKNRGYFAPSLFSV